MSEKKRYDDGDPYNSICEQYMARYPKELVHELIEKMDNIPDGGLVYGNFGRRMTVEKQQRNQEPSQSPVGRVDVEANPNVTICADCTHCVPDMQHSGKHQLAYAKCALTADHIPDKVNVITGEKISKLPKMDYCSNKNHGECPDWKSKKLVRGLRKASNRPDRIKAILDKLQDGDVEEVPVWEDVKSERNNPWLTTIGLLGGYLEGVKSFLSRFKFE